MKKLDPVLVFSDWSYFTINHIFPCLAFPKRYLQEGMSVMLDLVSRTPDNSEFLPWE